MHATRDARSEYRAFEFQGESSRKTGPGERPRHNKRVLAAVALGHFFPWFASVYDDGLFYVHTHTEDLSLVSHSVPLLLRSVSSSRVLISP